MQYFSECHLSGGCTNSPNCTQLIRVCAGHFTRSQPWSFNTSTVMIFGYNAFQNLEKQFCDSQLPCFHWLQLFKTFHFLIDTSFCSNIKVNENLLSFHPGNSCLPQSKTEAFNVYKVYAYIKKLFTTDSQ